MIPAVAAAAYTAFQKQSTLNENVLKSIKGPQLRIRETNGFATEKSTKNMVRFLPVEMLHGQMYKTKTSKE